MLAVATVFPLALQKPCTNSKGVLPKSDVFLVSGWVSRVLLEDTWLFKDIQVKPLFGLLVMNMQVWRDHRGRTVGIFMPRR